VVGPLARDLDSITLLTRETIHMQPWLYDAKVHPIPWRNDLYDEVQSRPLVIGYLVDDGMVKVHPPIELAVKEACLKLQEAGHEVMKWDVSGHAECIQIMVSAVTCSFDHS
jgi:amidase